jgi:very-short-patch-repair endonuclease
VGFGPPFGRLWTVGLGEIGSPRLALMGELAVVDVVQRLGGTAGAAQLVDLCGSTALRRALASGVVVRVARGRYALPAFPDPWLSAVRLGGVASHTSAARIWGFAVVGGGEPPHVTVRRRRHGLDAHGVTLHWADLAARDVADHRPVTTPLRTVLDCARTLPLGAGLAVADSALRTDLIGSAELRMAADALRGAGRRRVRRVAQAADRRAESPLESCLRAVFLDAGIAGFEPQVVIRDGSFRVRVDLADVRRRIVAEADSFEHHGHRSALVRDCERYDELVALGWRVVRFTWEHVMFRPEWVAGLVQSVAAQPLARGIGGQKSSSGQARSA